MPDLASALAHIRSAWISGRSALEYCPPAWRGAVDGDRAECALAALAGHATQALFRPAPTSPLVVRSLLPRLAAPTLPERLRPQARRLLLRASKTGALFERPLIELIAARGYAMHPADWTPSPRDDWAPDIYAPWLDWIRGEEKPSPPSLTLETYDQWSFAMRCAALIQLRASDPAVARVIIAAKASAAPAERRAKLIDILETGLCEEDREFLEGQTNDRSDRVQAMARAYLARLGRRVENEPLAAELAAMVEVRLLSRRRQLAVPELKIAAQNARRLELFKQVGLADLAHALGLAEEDIFESAPTGAPDGLGAFVHMVAATGRDRACRLLLDHILDDEAFPLQRAEPLGARLSIAERRALLPRILKRDDEMFQMGLALMGRALGEAPLSALIASPGYAALVSAVEAYRSEDPTQRLPAQATLETALLRVGLLADGPAAAELIQRLTAAGLFASDPKLDLLHLNAALTPETRS